MNNLVISVVNPAGEIHTYQELIIDALTARTYSAVGADQARILADYLSRYKAALAAEVFTNPMGEIYIMDAYKGVRNGVVTAGAYVAGDFTVEPGGGELLTQGKFNPAYSGVTFQLGNRLIYSVAEVVIYLDVTLV